MPRKKKNSEQAEKNTGGRDLPSRISTCREKVSRAKHSWKWAFKQRR